MNHTPAPWTVDPRVLTRVEGPNRRGICSTGGFQDSRMDPETMTRENEANALLIAAAPELLGAAAFALSVLRSTAVEASEWVAIAKLEDAITAATGKRP